LFYLSGNLVQGTGTVLIFILKSIPDSRIMAGSDNDAVLWLAVIMMAPPAFFAITPKLMTGVGVALGQRYTFMPLPAITSAAAEAKSSEAKRVS